MKSEFITIPGHIQWVLRTLTEQGFDGYLVGGCVRDALLGKEPADWDITTSALPEEILSCFPQTPVVTIGKKHGTIALLLEEGTVEITTFRTESGYQDHRHPTLLSFTASLEEDLSRRDFTINAMAYHPEKGLVDCFQGQNDFALGWIRTVRDPIERFQEDALRILRGLRFAGQLQFAIAPETAAAIWKTYPLLDSISKERIQTEFNKLLLSPGGVSVLRNYAPIFFYFLPELEPMQGFLQNTPYHCYDVWEHTLHALEATPQDLILRLAVLLHDCGKPHTYQEDEAGVGHFPQHAKKSTALAEQLLTRLRYDKKTIQRVCQLVLHHDLVLIPELAWVRRQCNRFGVECFQQLLAMHRSDTLAQSPRCFPRLDLIRQCEQDTMEILEQQQCFQRKDLAITGKDLLTLGIPPGKSIGAVLQILLDAVLEGTCPNEPNALQALAAATLQTMQEKEDTSHGNSH